MKKFAYTMLMLFGVLMSIAGLVGKGNGALGKGMALFLFLGGVVMLIAAIAGFVTTRSEQHHEDTQRLISDLDILRLFEQQKGGLLSTEMLAKRTGLTKAQMQSRLTTLSQGGLLTAGPNPTGMKYYYELAAPLEEQPGLVLSDQAFLVVEDLQKIFEAYDYKVSPHDLMVSTGLPWKVLSREMQYFRKQGIVDVAYIARPGDASKQYILMDDYHPSQTLDLNSRERINAEVKQVLYDENLLV